MALPSGYSIATEQVEEGNWKFAPHSKIYSISYAKKLLK